ncbi:unnamed protein product [Bathycoccus prasinos]
MPSSSSSSYENDAMLHVLKETPSTFETLARDFPEHCLLVVAGGSCLFVHVFSRVLMNSRSSSGGRKREEHQSTTKEFLSPVRGGGSNDLATTIEEKRFSRLRTRYNIVYVFATFGDWIQGAYLYALYREHGFTMQSIGFIFVLGYASSAFLGTIVASLGDRYGHKVNCVLYGFAYAFVCVVSSRRSDVFSLYFARVLGGICYSLLFSSFEAWAIAECDRKKIHRRNLARLFASATFFNALSAVVAGIIGNAVVDTFSRKNGYYTGSQSRTLPRLQTADEARVERPLPELRIKTSLFVTEKEPNEFAPAFDVAAGALFLCGCLCASLWVNNKTKVNREDEENDEGDENASFEEDGDEEDEDREDEEDATKIPPRGRTLRKTRRKRRGGILESFKIVATRPELLSLGTTNSLYEAALHVFVFIWTPALEKRKDADQTVSGFVPHGVVFSLFMTCKMLGSMTYSILSSVQRKRPYVNVSVSGDNSNNTSIAQTRKSLRYVFLAAAISFFWTVVFKESYFVALFAFCAFEFGLGVYWPAMAVLRGELVPNNLRASVTSVFRVPLNVLVVMLLTAAGRASERALLLCCAAMMSFCFILSVNEG